MLQLIKNLAVHFHPEKYRDTYQEELQNLINAKAHGKTVAAKPHKKMVPVIDLVSVLQRSVKRRATGQGEKRLLHTVPKQADARRKHRKAS